MTLLEANNAAANKTDLKNVLMTPSTPSSEARCRDRRTHSDGYFEQF